MILSIPYFIEIRTYEIINVGILTSQLLLHVKPILSYAITLSPFAGQVFRLLLSVHAFACFVLRTKRIAHTNPTYKIDGRRENDLPIDQRIYEIAVDRGCYAGTLNFHPAVRGMHRLHFSFRGYCRRSGECRLKRPSWPLAMKWQAALHSDEAKREPVSTALLHFSPFSRLWFSVGGHRPHRVHTDGTPLCNANVSQ